MADPRDAPPTPSTPSSIRTFGSVKTFRSRRSLLPPTLRNSPTTADVGISRVSAQPHFQTTSSAAAERLISTSAFNNRGSQSGSGGAPAGDTSTRQSSRSSDLTSSRQSQPTTTTDNDHASLGQPGPTTEELASPSAASPSVPSTNRAASIGWLTLRGPPTNRRGSTSSRKSSSTSQSTPQPILDLASSVETIRPSDTVRVRGMTSGSATGVTSHRNSKRDGRSQPPPDDLDLTSAPLTERQLLPPSEAFDLSSPVQPSAPVILSSSPKEDITLLPSALPQDPKTAPTLVVLPVENDLPPSQQSTLLENSASGSPLPPSPSPSPAPSRSNWFSTLRRSSLPPPEHNVTSSGSSSVTLKAPESPSLSRPGDGTPGSAVPDSSSFASSTERTAATRIVIDSSSAVGQAPTDLQTSEPALRPSNPIMTGKPPDVAYPSSQAVVSSFGRRWFSSSKTSLDSSTTSADKGKPKDDIGVPVGEATSSQVVGTSTQAPSHDAPPTPTAVPLSSSTPIRIPQEKKAASAPGSAKATPVTTTRGWFGVYASPVGGRSPAPSVKGKERDVEQPDNTSTAVPKALEEVPVPVPVPSVTSTLAADVPPKPTTSSDIHAPPTKTDASSEPVPVNSPTTGSAPSAAVRYTFGLSLLGRRTRVADESSLAAKSVGSSVQDTPVSRDVISDSGKGVDGAFDDDRGRQLRPDSVQAVMSTGVSKDNGLTNQSASQTKSPVTPATNGSQPHKAHSVQSRPDVINARDEAQDPTSPQSATSDPASSATTAWWNYLGLGGGPTAYPPPVNIVQTPLDDPTPPPAVPVAERKHSPSRSASSSANRKLYCDDAGERSPLMSREPKAGGEHLPSKRDNSAPPPSSQATGQEDPPARASSLTSAPGNAGWYGSLWPWAYSAQPVASATEKDGGVIGTGETTKTEAELVKEEALRNTAATEIADTPRVATSAETPETEELLPDEASSDPSPSSTPNPIVVHAPAKSWMSFFSSSNTLAIRKITDGSSPAAEPDGMEVMEIPDELDGALDAAPVKGLKGAPSDKHGLGSPTSPSRPTSSERGRVGAPRNVQTDGELGGDSTRKRRSAPPLTNSDNVRKKVLNNVASTSTLSGSKSSASTRTASPIPSSKGTAKEKERLNFVLPTFGDTFYTLPRGMPPTNVQAQSSAARGANPYSTRRMASGIKKKTFNFVSSWLGDYSPAGTSHSSTVQPRKPSDEMLHYLEERRERITRSWLGNKASISSSASSSSIADSSSVNSGSTLTVAAGSGSAHPVPASSLVGVTSQNLPIGRIAHKGLHHVGASSNSSFASATAMAKTIGTDLPRIWDVLDSGPGGLGDLATAKRVVVIGVHGWFPGAMIRSVLGEPTGTSSRLASMMGASVEDYAETHDLPLERLTLINLEGEGTIARRVAKLYQDLLDHPDWVEDVHLADVIFVATHSQGSIVSTQLIASLIEDGHIRTGANNEAVQKAFAAANRTPPSESTRVVCLAMCGIHLGPLLYLNTSSFTTPYFTYFESAAARELFEFQDTSTEVSQRYIKSLTVVLEHGVKFLYVSSLDDQVVPIYSGAFMTASHPLILRAVYIDGDAYNASDFLSNLIVFLLRLRNAGLDDGGLITHLSEATAGSLSGVGHSTPYMHRGCYDLAVRYMFETTGAVGASKPEFHMEPFQAKATRNDYEIPWALRGVISDPAVLSLFASEIAELRQAFDEWAPKTTILKDLRRKLEPIQSLRILPPSPLALHSHDDNKDVQPPPASKL